MAAESAAIVIAPQFDKPDIPERCRAGLTIANADRPLANVESAPILKRLYEGANVKTIAAEYGVSHVAMYAYLVRTCPEEWMAISTGRSLARLEEAEVEMDDADDQLTVSKARESHRMGAWTLERVARHFYGDTKNQNGVTVNVVIDRSAGETTIEGEKT